MSDENAGSRLTHHDDDGKEPLPLSLLHLLWKPPAILQLSSDSDKVHSAQELADEKQVRANFLSGTFGRPNRRVFGRYKFITDEVKDIMEAYRASEALSEQEKIEANDKVLDAAFAVWLAGQEMFFAATSLTKLLLLLSSLTGVIQVIIAIHYQLVNPQHVSRVLLTGFDGTFLLVFALFLLLPATIPYLLVRVLPGTLLPRPNLGETGSWWFQIQMWLFLVNSLIVGVLTYPQGPQHYPVWYFHSLQQMVKSASVVGLETTLVIWLIVLSCMLCFVVAMYVERWAIRQRTPDLFIINSLRNLLYEVEERRNLWTDFSVKSQIMSMIEDLAVCLEEYLPLKLLSGDASSDSKIKQAGKERAAYFRSLKMWIAIPMPDTRQRFAESVARNLVHAARGDWERLDNVPPEKVEAKAWQARLLSVVRGVIVASLPAMLLWVVRRPPLHLTMPSYANVAVLIWAVITLLVELDPSFAAKAEALKTIKEVFSGGKEK